MDYEKLYQMAFAYRDRRLWEKLEDDQIYAVQVGDRVGYVNIMGLLGEHIALAVYPGQEGMDGLWRILQVQTNEESESEMLAAGLGQNALHCEFVPQEEMEKDVLDVLKGYAKAHGISTRGKKNLWPQFTKYRPYREPGPVAAEEDLEMLTAALEGAIWLADRMGEDIRTLQHLGGGGETIPLLRRDGEGWKAESIPMPPEPDICYPIGHTPNEIYEAKARKLKKQGEWACKVVPIPEPAEAEGMEEKVFPWALLTVDLATGGRIEVQRVRDYETRTDVMLDKLMEAMFRENVCPKEIQVADDRTESLLEDWTLKVGIELIREEECPEELQELESIALMGDDEEAAMARTGAYVDFLLSLPEELLREMGELPPEMGAMFEEMRNDPDLPDSFRKKIADLQAHLHRALGGSRGGRGVHAGRGKKGGRKKTGPEKTLVISVSLGTGCYRHIRISSQALLETLSDAILRAFEFDDDHAHGFFLDNRAYSPVDAYYVNGMEDDSPATDQVTLAEAGLRVGQKFKYIFDFGEDWTFQCRVLKEMEEITGTPETIRSVGAPPPQYPEDDEDWDEDWDEEDDEEDDGWDEDE